MTIRIVSNGTQLGTRVLLEEPNEEGMDVTALLQVSEIRFYPGDRKVVLVCEGARCDAFLPPERVMLVYPDAPTE